MRVAVVGQGISGMVAARLLSTRHDVTVFEARSRLGGHSHTVEVPSRDGSAPVPVDTGFIVFNLETYPNFVRLLRALDVPSKPTDMSFSVRCADSGLEYASHSLSAMFARRRNALDPRYWAMLRDIVRFNREAPALLERKDGDPGPSLGEFLRRGRYSDGFVEDHLLPLGASVWSTPTRQMLEFPARSFARFFHNHGFLRVTGRTPWLTIDGGSREYVRRLTAPYAEQVRLGTRVEALRRRPDGVTLTLGEGREESFDRVVLACHGDQALRILGQDARPLEQEVLGAFRTSRNEVVWHADAGLMPSRRRAWAAWNFLRERGRTPDTSAVAISYWMNSLQSLPERAPQVFVTLNAPRPPAPEQVFGKAVYRHPVMDRAAVAAQARHAEVDGLDRVHFCGAYWRYGFHEDGVWSALNVCRALGIGLEALTRPASALSRAGVPA